ncbi:MAG: HipA domain-containing protein, partial [Pseudomonadota bacterium]
LGCNRDDHTKNFGFLLAEDGRWELAPAFDVSYAHNPQAGKWTATQQMSVAGKREGITREDFIAIGRQCGVATVPRLNAVIDQVTEVLQKLAEKVTAAMQTLALAGARFEIALNSLAEGNASGLEEIEFLASAHQGITPRPLAKVASGGELSRISLAIQTVTSEIAQVPTLIFDEVDAGIGGRVAEIVGRMLKNLGKKHQVMCVTHLPQVAASADQQWQVTKTAANGKVLSHATVLDDKQRVEEIARMLGGVKMTETTRRHAAEMLKAVIGDS